MDTTLTSSQSKKKTSEYFAYKQQQEIVGDVCLLSIASCRLFAIHIPKYRLVFVYFILDFLHFFLSSARKKKIRPETSRVSAF